MIVSKADSLWVRHSHLHNRCITNDLCNWRVQLNLYTTCPFGTFAYQRMPFGLCNAPATFQRCMISIFSDMVERFLEIFMDDFSVFGSSFKECLHRLKLVLVRCKEKLIDHSKLPWKLLERQAGNDGLKAG